jgi:membrane protease YdiL (CAAX protease family)
MKARYAALALLIVGPAVAFRLSGVGLWATYGAVVAIAAALAAWELHQDGALRDVMRREGFDLMIGLAVAAALFASVTAVFRYWVAPESVGAGLLNRCRIDGPLLPRLEPRGLDHVAEWLRSQTCKGYGASLGIDLRLRSGVVFVVAALEELAWRGGVQQLLSEKLGSTRGWVVTSLLFAAAHLLTPTPALALLALPCGLAWGALYRYRGRLLTAMFSHAVFSMFLFSQMPLVRFG